MTVSTSVSSGMDDSFYSTSRTFISSPTSSFYDHMPSVNRFRSSTVDNCADHLRKTAPLNRLRQTSSCNKLSSEAFTTCDRESPSAPTFLLNTPIKPGILPSDVTQISPLSYVSQPSNPLLSGHLLLINEIKISYTPGDVCAPECRKLIMAINRLSTLLKRGRSAKSNHTKVITILLEAGESKIEVRVFIRNMLSLN